MRIVFVRHGHPDYKKDCLTELGHSHAEAAAKRLSEEEPTRIFASPMGRAKETAEHIAERLNKPIEILDFMHEIKWGSANGEPVIRNGHPWFTADDMVANGDSVMRESWASEEPYSNNLLVENVKLICEGFDGLLSDFGYSRDGYYYRVEKENPDTVFVVSHGGSSSVVLSHLLNVSFPHFCATVRPDFTAITVIKLSGDIGSLVTPHIEILNDSRHIKNINTEATFDK